MDDTPPTTKLADLIAGWPSDGPEDLAELQFLPDEAIAEIGDAAQAELVRQIRTQVRRAAISWGRSTQLSSPEAVEKCLANGDLRLLTRQWVCLALDRNRRRTFRSFGADSSRTVEKITKWVPNSDKLPTLPENGVFLLLYGGGPEVLEIDDVRDRLCRLQQAVPVADVLFRRRDADGSTLFSLRQGFGVRNHERVEFPRPDLAELASLWHQREGLAPAQREEAT